MEAHDDRLKASVLMAPIISVIPAMKDVVLGRQATRRKTRAVKNRQRRGRRGVLPGGQIKTMIPE